MVVVTVLRTQRAGNYRRLDDDFFGKIGRQERLVSFFIPWGSKLASPPTTIATTMRDA
jgi:hypothetical protein